MNEVRQQHLGMEQALILNTNIANMKSTFWGKDCIFDD